MRVVWFLACLFPIATSLCFQQVEAKGRRDVLRDARPVIDEYECRIDCTVATDCKAFFYQEKERICWLLGQPMVNQTCAPPKMEHLRVESYKPCTEISQNSTIDGYKRNPLIPVSIATVETKTSTWTPCEGTNKTVIDVYFPDGTHHVSSNADAKVSWERYLGTWIYTLYKDGKQIYVRGAACIEPPLSNATESCPVLPPCSNQKYLEHESVVYNTMNPCKHTAEYPKVCNARIDGVSGPADIEAVEFITCIYGSWFRITGSGTREIVEASCIKKQL